MMLSMTAFARQQLEQDWGSLTWEIRSVNHRYLETSVRVPETFRRLEIVIRETVRKRLSRGKVECQLRYQSVENSTTEINLNQNLVFKLLNANKEIGEMTGSSGSLSNMEILRWPGVVSDQQMDTASIDKQAIRLFSLALDDLISSREREGEELKGFVQKRLDAIREIVISVRAKMPEILTVQKQNLLDKIDD